MISNAQHVEKLKRIKKVIDSFLAHENISINQLSEIINISPSTIQRDLHELEYIRMIYADEAKEKLKKISERLKQNKKKGISIGGINSTTHNVPIRDENGKFTGNKKR